MRYPSEHKQERRAQIVEAASRLFRAHGITSTGVDAVMSAVGLTAGGFYNHFSSKHELVMEGVRKALRDNRERLTKNLPKEDDALWIAGFVRLYAGRQHRDHPEEGCPLAALASELPHVEDAHVVIAEEVDAYARLLAEKLPARGGVTARQRALALFAMLVGVITLARALKGSRLSDELLSACQAVAAQRLA